MTDQLKQEITQLGWHYKGQCACSSKALKYVKDGYRLEVSPNKSMWVITKNNVVQLKGGWETLIDHLRKLEEKINGNKMEAA